jgi:thiamine biosynthesis protein ThiS
MKSLQYLGGGTMITINDNKIDWTRGLTIKKLLESMDYTDYHLPLMVVSLNGRHIPYDMFEKTIIDDGDEIKFFLTPGGG